MFSFCWRYIDSKKMAIYLLLCVLSGLVALVIPLIIGVAINASSQAPLGLEGAIRFCFAAMGAQGIRVLLAYLTELLNLDLQAHAGYLLNVKTVEHIERLPDTFFRGFDSAFYSQQINHDSNDLVIFVMNALVQAVSNVLTIFSVLVVLFCINWKIAAVCLVLGLLAACVYRLSRRVLFESGREAQERSSAYFARLLEQIDSIGFIRRHSVHTWFSAQLDNAFEKLYKALLSNQKASAKFTACNSLIEMLAYGCILMLSVSEIAQGSMDVGYLATALGYYSSLSSAVLFFMNWGKSYQDAKVCYVRLREIWDREEEDCGSIAVSSVRRISIRNLSVPLADNERRISYASCDFVRGHGVYVIAGANGSGKTTLLNALSGICPAPYEGRIEYDGVDLKQIDRYELRGRSVGYIEQDPMIVSGSLWDNLTLFSENSNKFEVDHYVDAFGLRPLVDELSEGMDSLLDGQGRSLSGGERQKIAIIRLLLKNPDVMFLDEPTSALDEESRQALIEMMREKSKNHLIVMVSHDQALIDAYDEVISLD